MITPDNQAVAITGANGFIGRFLIEQWTAKGSEVIPMVRRPSNVPGLRLVDFEDERQLTKNLQGVSSVVHLAARAHVMREQHPDSMAAYRESNVDLTVRVARAAVAAGVNQMIFMSSVKVNGEWSDQPFRTDDVPAPADEYGQSKWEAEQQLERIGTESGLKVCIVRPPLIYGPGVRANFQRLVHWVSSRRPLPLGAITNRRSMVSLFNLSDFLLACLANPAAEGVFFVSDGEDVSTPDLIRTIARSLGVRAGLFKVPLPMLKLALYSAGRAADFQRLCGSLQVDIEDTIQRLQWRPPMSLEEGVARTVVALEGRS